MKGSIIVFFLCGITALIATFYLVKLSKTDNSVVQIEVEDCSSASSSCNVSRTSTGDNYEQTSPSSSVYDFTIDTSSFKFSDDALFITANLIMNSMSTINNKKSFNCADFINNENVLGLGAKCFVNGDGNDGEGQLTIQLGTDPSIIKMGGLSVRKHFSSRNFEIVLVKRGAAGGAGGVGTGGKRRNYYEPFKVELTSDTTHIFKNKGSPIINLSASVSSATVKSLSWKVVSAPSSSAFETLKATLSTFSSSNVALMVSNLDIGVYTIQVIVKNSNKDSSSANLSFEIIDGVPPLISIKNRNSLKFIIGNLFIISPIVSFPSGYKGNGKLSNLKFNYSLEKGPSELTIKQKGELLVLSNDYTRIPTEGEYTFKLVVQEDGVPDSEITFKVTATSLTKRLSFDVLE